MNTAEALRIIWKAVQRPEIFGDMLQFAGADELVLQVSAKYGVPPVQIMGRSRKPKISVARQEAYWLVRHVMGLSYPSIAIYFGRDHSTIIHGVQQHEKRCGKKADLSPSFSKYPQPAVLTGAADGVP